MFCPDIKVTYLNPSPDEKQPNTGKMILVEQHQENGPNK